MSAFNCRSNEKIDCSTAANASMASTPPSSIVSFSNGLCAAADIRYNSAVNGTAAAMHLPIKREYDDEDSSFTDDSSSGIEWKSGVKSLKVGERAVDYSVTSPSYSSTDSNAANTSSAARKSTGSRRNGKDEKLSPEEEERRHMRRERNKVAAAKCRQKRVDLTNQLLNETKILEEEQSRLRDTIKSYQQEKEELEFVLEAHRVHCGAAIQQQASTTAHEAKFTSNKSEEPHSAEFVKSDAVMSSAICRPNRILGGKMSSSAMGEASTLLTPVLPSPVFVLGLQSMINGHTGLTPLTELPSEIIPTSESFMAEESKASFGLPTDSRLTTL